MRSWAQTRFTVGWALVGSLTFAGCDGPEAPATTSLSLRVDTVDGRVLVSHVGEGPLWTARERLRIGALGDAGGPARDDEFGRVAGVVAGTDGTIYVADAQARDVRVFSSDGVALRRIGREGRGPGEFASVLSLGMLGDTLAALDPSNGRIGLFSPAGEWLGQRPYARVNGPRIRIYQMNADEFSVPTSVGFPNAVFVRHTAGGAQESRPMRTEGTDDFYVYCLPVYFYPEWAPTALQFPAPEGRTVEAWAGEYRIALVGLEDDTIRVIERDYEPRVPTDTEWQVQVAMFDSMTAGRQCTPRRPVRPPVMELVRSMFFDDAGRLWVERRTDSGFVLDAFDHGGRLRGTVAIPNRVAEVPIFIRGTRLYFVVEDDLGVDQVVVYEVDVP